MYNLEEATKCLIKTGAALATDLHYCPEKAPSEKKVEQWRQWAMRILHLCQAANKEIKQLRAERSKTMGLLADVEYGLDDWSYPVGTREKIEKICDEFYGKGIRPE